jgi:hypothetical protein
LPVKRIGSKINNRHDKGPGKIQKRPAGQRQGRFFGGKGKTMYLIFHNNPPRRSWGRSLILVSVFSEFFLSFVGGDLPEFALSSAGHLYLSLGTD